MGERFDRAENGAKAWVGGKVGVESLTKLLGVTAKIDVSAVDLDS